MEKELEAWVCIGINTSEKSFAVIDVGPTREYAVARGRRILENEKITYDITAIKSSRDSEEMLRQITRFVKSRGVAKEVARVLVPHILRAIDSMAAVWAAQALGLDTLFHEQPKTTFNHPQNLN